MSRSKVLAWCLAAICLAGGVAQQTAFAQHGHGGGHHSGGHGGGHHFGGHSGHHSGGWGGGYGGGHHHHSGFGGWGGYGGYYPSYGYGGGYGLGGYSGYGNGSYYSQPIQTYSYIAPQPVYSMPVGPTPDGGEIVLFSPANTPGDVEYALNGARYTMRPGSVQRFTNDRTWTIELAPTNGQPPLRYTLVSSRYKFKPSANGMAVFQTQDAPGTASQATNLPPAPVPMPLN